MHGKKNVPQLSINHKTLFVNCSITGYNWLDYIWPLMVLDYSNIKNNLMSGKKPKQSWNFMNIWIAQLRTNISNDYHLFQLKQNRKQIGR